MSKVVVPFTRPPDRAAQYLYLGVAAQSDALAKLVDLITYATVSGPETRRELARAADLLTEARVILERVERRETRTCLSRADGRGAVSLPFGRFRQTRHYSEP